MKKTKKIIEENNVIEETAPFFRQVSIAGMNESVCISSSDKQEDLNFIANKTYRLFKKIKNGK